MREKRRPLSAIGYFRGLEPDQRVNPSQILGKSSTPMVMMVLQNAKRLFMSEESAAIAAHGLIMTTASTPAIQTCPAEAAGFSIIAAPNRANHQLRQDSTTDGGPAFLICERTLKTTARFPHRDGKNWFVCGVQRCWCP